MSSILAIDWGGKRCGVALADNQARLPRPQPVVENTADLLTHLKSLCRKEDVTALVVGLPLGLEGGDTMQTATVRHFADQLAAATGLPVSLQAETLSTQAADALKPQWPQAPADSLAAVIILQDYLDNHAR